MQIVFNLNLPGSSHTSQTAGGPEREQVAMAGEVLHPFTEEDIWNFILRLGIPPELLDQYLRDYLHVDPVRHDIGSLVVTVECNSLKILEGLWEDYCSGHLNEVAQETLITAEVLEKFGLSEIKLKTYISEKDYESTRQTLMEIKVEPEKENESGRQTFTEIKVEPEKENESGRQTFMEIEAEPERENESGRQTFMEIEAEPEKENEIGGQTFMAIEAEPEKENEIGRQTFIATGEPHTSKCIFIHSHVKQKLTLLVIYQLPIFSAPHIV